MNDVKQQPIKLSNSFINEGEKPLDIRWWQAFTDDELNELVTKALLENLPLKVRKLRLKSKAIESKIASAGFYPTLNFNTSTAVKLDNLSEINTASVGLSATWELDIWGEISANDQKVHWQYQGQQALYRANANLVAGNISHAWFSLKAEKHKQIILNAQFKRTENALKVISRRFAMGKNSVTHIWQQQKLLKSIEVQQAKNKASIFSEQQALALWLGIKTNQLKPLSSNSQPSLPQLPKMGLPAKVLLYRPDIEQAFAKIKAADAQVAVAISDQYPRITLKSSYSSSKNDTRDLLENWAGNLIASLTLPLFDSGTKKNVVSQKKLLLQALIIEYQQVWLEAIASVNQVLVNEIQLLEVAGNLKSQLLLAKKTEKLTSIRYLNGKSTYLNLLKAQESILALERQLIDADKNIMNNRVLLYRELSHGDFEQSGISDNKIINKGIKS